MQVRGRVYLLMIILSWGWLAIGGCSGPQSALEPAGTGAARISQLFWWMASFGVLIWLIVVGLAVYAIRINPAEHDHRRARRFVIGGGVVFPTAILTVLLIFGLQMLPALIAPAPEGSLEIRVRGAQWWWRVEYLPPNATTKQTLDQTVTDQARFGTDEQSTIELANEIRLPVGQPVQFYLESEDVIHSFWIPALGGKVDMLPGRQTRLTLLPTRTGVFRGACAEYCGTSHAKMNFYVIVMPVKEFERWLADQRSEAAKPQSAEAERGRRAFFRNGCQACHAIRGTRANSHVGPDLTHVASRMSLAAGVFEQPALESRRDLTSEVSPLEAIHFHRWLSDPEHFKPGVHMPAFDMLGDDELEDLASFLSDLN